MSLVDDILAATFGAALPTRVDALVDRELVLRRIEDFELGPVLPFGATRNVRVAISHQHDSAGFRQRVLAAFPHPGLARFWDSVPEATRRMIDTDGDTASVYLDDLQDLGLPARNGHPVMFLTFDTSNGRMGVATRHSEPPRELVDGWMRDALERLLGLGATGIWSVRWEQKRPVGLVWVSESRHRKNPEASVRVVEALGSHPAWPACRSLAEKSGFRAYADAVEALGDGSWDVTVGFCRS